MSPEYQSRRLSWIEITLLVVGSLIIIALVLPALHASREAARQQLSRNHLKDFGLALHSYHDSFQLLPPGGTFRDDGTPLHSWTFLLNGYMAQVAPYFVIDRNLPWDDPVNWSPMSHAQYMWINSYLDPSVPTSKTTEGFFQVHYAPNEWLMHRNSSVRMKQIPDQSGTLLMADAFGDFAIFGDPINWRDPTIPFRSSPTGFGHLARREITHVLYADGRVSSVMNIQIAPEVFRALAGPEELRPTATQVALRDKPYQPPTTPVWTYLIALRGHKSLMKFSLSPDKQRLIANFGRDREFEFRDWQDDFTKFVKGASITHIEVKGIFDPQELRVLLRLPTVKTISLTGNAPQDEVASTLKEFPQVRVIDHDPEP
jgi:hypothetical protein